MVSKTRAISGYMNKKLINITIIALLLINAGTLALLWAKPGRDRLRPKGHPVEKILKKDLGFNAEQMAQFEQLKEQHHQSVSDLKKSTRQHRETLFSSPPLESNQADSIAKLMGQGVADIEYATWRHFQDVRNLCTEEQVAKFDELLSDIARHMGPRHPKGHPPKR
jgi:protein CpxP